MHRFPTRYLWLSSLLILLFTSCRYARYQVSPGDPVTLSAASLLPVIPADGSARTYKASIDVLSRHFSGLIIVKQTDSLTRHLVFVTELGMKMFDFQIRDTAIAPVYVFEPLNKPKLIKLLEQDFSTILLLQAYGPPARRATAGRSDMAYLVKENKNSHFYIYQQDNALILQETFHKHKRKTRTAYTYQHTSRSYSSIQFKQYGLVKIYIALTEIPKTNG